MGGACSAYGRKERRIQGFGGKPECKRTLWRPRRRWEDNIKIDLQEVGCGDMNWIELAYLTTSGFSLFQHSSTTRYPWLRISKSSENLSFVSRHSLCRRQPSVVSQRCYRLHTSDVCRCFFFFLFFVNFGFNPLNAELNPICHLLALLGGATIVVVSRLRVKWALNTSI